jgi:hypothetical protein
MTFKEIVDSKTDNVCSKKSNFTGVAGSKDAAAPQHSTITEMRKSQADGNEGIGLADQSFNGDCKDFNQGVDTTGNYDASSTSKGDEDSTPSLPWTRS